MRRRNLMYIFLYAFITLPICPLQSFAQKSHDFKYHVLHDVPINELRSGKILGLANQKIISTKIIKGNLPYGITLFDDGTLAVTKENIHLEKNKINVNAEFVDALGNLHRAKLKLRLAQQTKHNDHIASVRLPKKNDPNIFNNGDIIARFIDPDGILSNVTLVKGSLPSGVSIIHNKHLVVTNIDQLHEGEYFCLFITEDAKGGQSVIALSLPISKSELYITKSNSIQQK